MEQTIQTFRHPDGRIDRVQVVRLDGLDGLRFVRPAYDGTVFSEFCAIYRDHIVKKYGRLLGKVILFTVDDDNPFAGKTSLGTFYDPLNIVTERFQKDIICRKGKIVFRNEETEAFFNKLKEEGRLFVFEGKRQRIDIMPVGRKAGFMSHGPSASLKVNTSFFVMDPLDRRTVFDHCGLPFGLMIEKGRIISPPLFDREAFLIDKNGRITIRPVALKEIGVVIGGKEYRDGVNCRFYSRPEYRRTAKGRLDIVISDNEIVAVNDEGATPVPSGGFIISPDEKISDLKDRRVSYSGLDRYVFGLQGGNSVLVKGKKTERFISPFYQPLKHGLKLFPPVLYPHDLNKTRAPRILFGADKQGRLMIIWIEGAGKYGHVSGEEGEGATLMEAAQLAERVGMHDAIHLDGGGSAQILYHDERYLRLSDRDPLTFREKERAVPVMLAYEEN